MTENFSHNLKIAIVNQDGSVLSGEFADQILEKVYEVIANKVIRKDVHWTVDTATSKLDCVVLWQRKVLKNDTEKWFIGDLFTTSMVCDSLLYQITGRILLSVEQKIKAEIRAMCDDWIIAFNISKILDTRMPNYHGYKTKGTDQGNLRFPLKPSLQVEYMYRILYKYLITFCLKGGFQREQ